VGLLFYDVCGVLLNVLSRSAISFFRRGSLDESVLRSVNLQIAKRKNEDKLPAAYFCAHDNETSVSKKYRNLTASSCCVVKEDDKIYSGGGDEGLQL